MLIVAIHSKNTIKNRYIELVNEKLVFHIHEVANGAEWNHGEWMDNIFIKLRDVEFNLTSKYLRNILSQIKITTALGDTLELRTDKNNNLAKIINGKVVYGECLWRGLTVK